MNGERPYRSTHLDEDVVDASNALGSTNPEGAARVFGKEVERAVKESVDSIENTWVYLSNELDTSRDNSALVWISRQAKYLADQAKGPGRMTEREVEKARKILDTLEKVTASARSMVEKLEDYQETKTEKR